MPLVLGLLLVVASGAGGFGGAGLSTAVMPAQAASTCAEARAEIVAAGSPRALEADVDGDGAADRVFLATRRDAPPRCRYFLVAETGGAAIVRPIRVAERDASFAAEMRIPELLALAEVDRRPGAEAVVVAWRGASTEFARIYALREGTFVPLRVPGSVAPGRDTFPYAGSVGNAFAVDCGGRASGLVRTVSAANTGRNYTLGRRLYVLRGAVFRVSARRTSRVDYDRIDSHPAFRRPGPFASCTVAGGVESG